MEYTIKAIPTTYAGVNFRSRLEARWAAFFDLADIKWEYEPFDLEGWAPDFMLRTEVCNVLCEVKPVDLSPRGVDTSAYKKAEQYWSRYQILLLGLMPLERGRFLARRIGLLMDPPRFVDYAWVDVIKELEVRDQVDVWREAGNLTQWNPAEPREISITEMIQNGLRRAAEQRSAA
jgi:hypothetical protein